MKGILSRLLCVLLLGCAAAETRAADTPAAEGYVLAKKGKTIWAVLPPGKWNSESSSIKKELKVTVEGPSGKKDIGSITEETGSVLSLERISDTKVRAGMVKVKFKNTAVIEGKESTTTDPPTPPMGLPFIMEKQEDGSFRTVLETGTANPEQSKIIEGLARPLTNQDLVGIYGEKPRKPGEKWPVKIALVEGLLPTMEGASGTASAEFVTLEELRGSRCAVIRLPFKITGICRLGKDLPPSDTTFEGEMVIHRSLAGLVDLDSKLDTKMVAVSRKEGMGTMTISGQLISTTRLVPEKR